MPLFARRAGAQTTQPVAGSELSVYLMTFGPGDDVYEKFGHNAIRVRDLAHHTDIAYNYGIFNLDEAGFLRKFLAGRMFYWMEGWDAGQTAWIYEHDQRSIWLQELNLTPNQRVKLRDFLEWNRQEANKHYLYDYYTNNCSTKVRDALDNALDGQIKQQLASKITTRTYRWHTKRLMADDLLPYFGLTSVMGHYVDRPLSEWEESFLPEKLQEYVRQVMVVDETGKTMPLVKREWTYYSSPRPPEHGEPPTYWPGFLAIGTFAGAVLVGLSWFGQRRRWAKILFVVLATLWALVIGVGGLVGIFFWAFTTHVATYYNENLLQISPLMILLVILIPLTLRQQSWARRSTVWFAGIILAISLLGLMLKILPAFRQDNLEIIAMTLPASAGMFLAMKWNSTLQMKSK